MFTYECPSCFEMLDVEDTYANQPGSCNKCGHHIMPTQGGFQLYGLLLDLSKNIRIQVEQKIQTGRDAGHSIEDICETLTEITELDLQGNTKLKEHEQSLIDNGLSGRELFDELQSMHKQLLCKRIDMIVNTFRKIDINSKFHAQAKENGKRWKRWVTACDEFVSDVDEANQAAGWIAIDTPFPSCDQHPPSKTFCSCTIAYSKSKPDKYAKKLVKEDVKRQSLKKSGNGNWQTKMQDSL